MAKEALFIYNKTMKGIKRMRKLIVLLLCGFLCLNLCGCGDRSYINDQNGTGDHTSQDTPDTPSDPSAPIDPDDKDPDDKDPDDKDPDDKEPDDKEPDDKEPDVPPVDPEEEAERAK